MAPHCNSMHFKSHMNSVHYRLLLYSLKITEHFLLGAKTKCYLLCTLYFELGQELSMVVLCEGFKMPLFIMDPLFVWS